jgi:site-specific recombinase XerD
MINFNILNVNLRLRIFIFYLDYLCQSHIIYLYNDFEERMERMGALVNNVVGFDNKSVHSTILAFLDYKGDLSSNTRKAYEKDIKIFFMYTRGKELNQLIHSNNIEEYSDLRFTKEDVVKYRNYLQKLKKPGSNDKKYKNKSINRMINSLRSLYDFLVSCEYKVNKDAFKLKDLPENDSEEIGYLKLFEMEKMVELAKTLPNGLQKSLFIELGWKTSLRMEALLSLTWKDFERIDDDIWLVKAIEKGNEKKEMPITNDFYLRLLEIKTGDNNSPVFEISATTVRDTINTLKRMIGIEEDRNISFHSIRKFLIDWMIERGDLKGAALHAGHKSIETTWKHYAKKHKDYRSMAGIIIEQRPDISKLESLTKDELMGLIKNDQLVIDRLMIAYEKYGGA